MPIVKRISETHTLNIAYSPEYDSLVACIEQCDEEGYCNTIAYFKVDLGRIRASVMNALNNQVGWSWKDVKRSSNRLVTKVGKKKLLAKVNRVLNDPRFAKGMKYASAVYPPLGITYQAVRQSAKLVEDASNGVNEAKARILKIKKLAESGNPEALKTVRAMMVLNEAKKNSGINISGWADRLVSRNAKSSRPNTISKLRGFYSTGMKSHGRIIDVTATSK